MKKLILPILILLNFGAFAQTTKYTVMAGSGYEYQRGMHVRGSLNIPDDTTALPSNKKMFPALAYKGGVLYIWDVATQKYKPAGGAITGILNGTALIAAELPARWVDGGSNIDTLVFDEASSTLKGVLKPTDFSNFLAGYNKRVITASISGTTTKTLTITHADNTTTTATWTDLSGSGGVTDGDKGDITVSNTGGTFTIDPLSITEGKLATNSVTLDKIGGSGTRDGTTFFSGDGSFKTVSGSGLISIDSTLRINGTSLSVRLFANPLTYGADPTGVASSNAAFTAAFATGLPVVVPKAKFRLLNFAIPAGGMLFGYGDSSIIINEANDRGIIPGNNAKVDNIHFVGPGKNTGLPFNTGIFLYQSVGWEVTRCRFTGFSGAAQTNGGGGIYATNLAAFNSDGGRMSDLYFDENNGGLVINGRAEYITATNITAGGNNVGVAIAAGNTVVNGGHFHNNGIGLKLYDGPNNGHGTVADVTINHNVVNIDASDINSLIGFTFDNIQVYYGTMKFTKAHNIRFNGGQISEIDSVSMNESTGIQMNNIFWGTNAASNGPIQVNVYNGGNPITFFGSDKSMVRGDLNLLAPMQTSASALDSVLVKDPTSGLVKVKAQSSLGGGTPITAGTYETIFKDNDGIIKGAPNMKWITPWNALYMEGANTGNASLQIHRPTINATNFIEMVDDGSSTSYAQPGRSIKLGNAASSGFYPTIETNPTNDWNSSFFLTHTTDAGSRPGWMFDARLISGPLVNQDVAGFGSYSNVYVAFTADGNIKVINKAGAAGRYVGWGTDGKLVEAAAPYDGSDALKTSGIQSASGSTNFTGGLKSIQYDLLDGSTNYGALRYGNTAGGNQGTLVLKDATTAFTSTIRTIGQAAPYATSYEHLLPNKSGTFAMLSDVASGTPGPQGEPGTAATVAVGTVTTGAPGSSVVITNVGNSTNATLNFTIPRGDVGATGPAGSGGAGGSDGFIHSNAFYAADGTDRTTAMNTFINVAGASGANLFLDSGIHAISNTVASTITRSNVTVIMHPKAVIRPLAGFPSAPMLQFSNVTNLKVKGLRFNSTVETINGVNYGVNETENGTARYDIYVTNSIGIDVSENIHINSPKASFYGENIKNADIYRNYMPKVQNYGIWVRGGAPSSSTFSYDINIHDNYVSGNGLAQHDASTLGLTPLAMGTKCDRIKITRNIFLDAKNTGAKVEGCHNADIELNYLEGYGKDGFKAQAFGAEVPFVNNNNIRNNTVKYMFNWSTESGAAILFSNVRGGIISGNVVKGGKRVYTAGETGQENGIFNIDSRGVLIDANEVDSVGLGGIYAENVTDWTASNNVITNYGLDAQTLGFTGVSNGIWVYGATAPTDASIVNNKVLNKEARTRGTGWAIVVGSGSKNTRVTGNTTDYPKEGAVKVDVGTSATTDISHNTFRNNIDQTINLSGSGTQNQINIDGNKFFNGNYVGVFINNGLSIGTLSISNNTYNVGTFHPLFEFQGTGTTVARFNRVGNVSNSTKEGKYNGLVPTVEQTNEFEFRGNGSPEGVVSAHAGARYTRKDGAVGTMLYHKTTTTGDNADATSTGWVANGSVASGSLINIRYLTTGTSYTPTAGTTRAEIHFIGGGGGGGGTSGAASNGAAGGGGGAGGYGTALVTVSDATAYAYTIGAGGSGGTGAANGTAGGTTTITIGATAYSATGGSFGSLMASGTALTFSAGGAGGTTTNGAINSRGEAGSPGTRLSGTVASGGQGGSTKYGGGGSSPITNTGGIVGNGYGAGGSGSASIGNSAQNGGGGAAGVIVVYEYR